MTATLLLLALLSGTLFFFHLGSPGLFDADEPAYAQAAREMLETGDWVTPHFNGRPRFDKPILFYWLITLSYRVFGITEFAVRCWSALAGVTLVLLIAWSAERWFGRPAGLWAGLAFSLNPLTALLARAAVTDMLLTLLVTLAILAGTEALAVSASSQGAAWPGARSARWAIIMWAAMALAVLVKGPIGLLVPGMALGGACVVMREIREGVRRLFPWQGLLVFAVLTVPWYALVLAANGWAFVEGFVIKHHLTRYAGVVSSHAGPIWFYVPVVLIGFFPWCGFLPRALWQAVAIVRRREGREHAERLLIVCACWVTGIFLFFSLAGTKLPSYLFPAFPAMAFLVGACGISSDKRALDGAGQGRGTGDRGPGIGEQGRRTGDGGRGTGGSFCEAPVPRWLTRMAPWIIGVMGTALALGFGAVPWILEILRPRAGDILQGVAAPIGLAVWLAGLLVAGTVGALLARGAWRPGLLAAMMGLLILTAEGMVAPQVYAIMQGALREFAEDARKILGPQGSLVVYGLNAPSIVFYAEHPVTTLGPGSPNGLGQIQRMAEASRPVVVICRSAHRPLLDGVPGLARLKSRGGYAIYSSRW